MKKFSLLLIILIIIGLFVGCQSKGEKAAIEEGLIYLDNDNYEQAFDKFNEGLVINENNKILKELADMTGKFINAKTSYDLHNFIDANNILNDINNNYSEYSLGEDIDNLKNKVKLMIDKKDILDGAIEKLQKINVKNNIYKQDKTNTYIRWYSDGEPMKITHLAVEVNTTKYPYEVQVALGWSNDLSGIDTALKEALSILQIDNNDELYNILINGVTSGQAKDDKVKVANNEVDLRVAQGALIAIVRVYADESEVSTIIDDYNKDQELIKEEAENKLKEEINDKISLIDGYIESGSISTAELLINELEGSNIPDSKKDDFDLIKIKFEAKREEINQANSNDSDLSEEEAIKIVSAIAVTDEYAKAVEANGGKISFGLNKQNVDSMSGYSVVIGESYPERTVNVNRYFVDKLTKSVYSYDIIKNKWGLIQ